MATIETASCPSRCDSGQLLVAQAGVVRSPSSSGAKTRRERNRHGERYSRAGHPRQEAMLIVQRDEIVRVCIKFQDAVARSGTNTDTRIVLALVG